jgi:hypothetical protein
MGTFLLSFLRNPLVLRAAQIGVAQSVKPKTGLTGSMDPILVFYGGRAPTPFCPVKGVGALGRLNWTPFKKNTRATSSPPQ